MQDLLSFIIQNILPKDEVFSVQTSDDPSFTQITVTVPEEQIGRIIGRDGHTIKAIRNLLAISFPGHRFSLEVNKPLLA